jgi:TonB family protein
MSFVLRGRLVLPLGIASIAAFPIHAARADNGLPTIVTYEISKQKSDARSLARDPKQFWIRQIVTRIEARKTDLDKPLKAPVTTKIAFVVARDGHLVSADVAASSGMPGIDKDALAMVRRAEPFPPMPSTLSEPELSFVVPLRFH